MNDIESNRGTNVQALLGHMSEGARGEPLHPTGYPMDPAGCLAPNDDSGWVAQIAGHRALH